MNTEIKLSDVTKALKNAGYKAITIDDAIKGRTPGTYYKYRGAMYIAGAKVGFAINNKADARIFGAYATGATNENGESFETTTSIPQFFFPRLFGYLAGENIRKRYNRRAVQLSKTPGEPHSRPHATTGATLKTE